MTALRDEIVGLTEVESAPPVVAQASPGPSRLVTLVVPTYNEAKSIVNTLDQITRELCDQSRGFQWELLIIDDGSSDSTLGRIIDSAHHYASRLKVVRHTRNYGLGGALQTAFQHSQGDVVVTLDADLTYDLTHVPQLLDAWCASDAAVVIASPYASGGRTIGVPRSLEVRSRLANRYLAAVSGTDVATFTGMVRAYDGDFVRDLAPTLRRGPSVNVEILYEAWLRGLRVVEIPATLNWSNQSERRSRTSLLRWRSLKESARVIDDGWRLRRVRGMSRGAQRRATAGTREINLIDHPARERAALIRSATSSERDPAGHGG